MVLFLLFYPRTGVVLSLWSHSVLLNYLLWNGKCRFRWCTQSIQLSVTSAAVRSEHSPKVGPYSIIAMRPPSLSIFYSCPIRPQSMGYKKWTKSFTALIEVNKQYLTAINYSWPSNYHWQWCRDSESQKPCKWWMKSLMIVQFYKTNVRSVSQFDPTEAEKV